MVHKVYGNEEENMRAEGDIEKINKCYKMA